MHGTFLHPIHIARSHHSSDLRMAWDVILDGDELIRPEDSLWYSIQLHPFDCFCTCHSVVGRQSYRIAVVYTVYTRV